MQLISYISQAFLNVSAVFDYLGANVPWLTAEGDTLTAGNLTLEKSATTAIKITDSVSGATLTTPSVSNSNANFKILITDSAVMVCQNTTGQAVAISSFIVGKSTDGTAEHYGAVIRTETSSGAAETVLTYGAVNVSSNGTRKTISSTDITQLIPVYSNETAYNVENAYLVFMTTQTGYVGKMELNGAKYVRCSGLALQYSE